MSYFKQQAGPFPQSSGVILPQVPFRSLFALAVGEVAGKRFNRDCKRPLPFPSKENKHSFPSTRRRSHKKKEKKAEEESYYRRLSSHASSLAPSNIITAVYLKGSPSEVSTTVDGPVFEKFMPSRRILSLAAHGPSLPRLPSLLSPRPRTPSSYRHIKTRPTVISSPGTGRSTASLDLTKSYWEVRYENWVESLGTQHHLELCSASTSTIPITEPIMHSAFPNISFNPAIFPRAGILSPREADPEITVLIDRDCASRGWSMDKIQRELFLHDMEIRLFFPAKLVPVKRTQNLKDAFRSARRWEWDWVLKWNIIRNLVFEATKARLESEYDDFLGDDLEMLQLEMDSWDENAMEIHSDDSDENCKLEDIDLSG